MAVRFGVLGPVEAHVDGALVDMGHARQRCVLVALLVDANRLVPVDALLDRVWGDRLPQRARNAVAGYVSRLRGVFGQASGIAFEHRPEGYRVAVDPDAVDIHRFRRLVAESRTAEGDRAVADLLDDALRLWRGDAFTALDTPWLDEVRVSLDADRLAATLDRNEVWLRLGRHAELLGELSRLAGEYPLDERLAGQLMLAQYRCDRQADALRHYETMRVRLADELGVDPVPSLRGLHQRILTADPVLAAAGPPAPAGGSAPAEISLSARVPVPRQLPAAPVWFVGRGAELAELDEALVDPGPGMVIHLITGTAGVGKTTLALSWAHRVAHRFGGGQLYLNLRGFDPGGSATTSAQALRVLLDSLGVPAKQIPSAVDAQSALLRSLLADKRVLMVLENARDADQVRPLLPGTAGCAVVITSRVSLAGLVVGHGARRLRLDVFNDTESRDLLAARIGRDRVAAEPEAVGEIVARCARLPLALAIVAARAVSGITLDRVASELSDSAGTLDALVDVDPSVDVRSVLSWSYRSLGPAAAQLFRRLGLHPGPEIDSMAAASLDGTSLAAARAAMSELTRAHLATERVPGRFALHDLLRAYAAELTQTLDEDADRRAATVRMLDHYLHTGYLAALAIHPHRHAITLSKSEPGVLVDNVAAAEAALTWFTTEHTALVRCVALAARDRFDRHAWQLAWTLTDYLDRNGHWQHEAIVHETALGAAQRLGDAGAQAAVHRAMGRLSVGRGRLDDATNHYQAALEQYRATDDHAGQGHTHLGLGWVLAHRDRMSEAIEHDRCAMALFRAAGHRLGQARSLLHLGDHRLQLGDHQQALQDCTGALVLFQGLGDRFGEAATYDSLGTAHHHLGQHERALTCYQRSVDLLRLVGDRYYEAVALNHLGDVHHSAGNVVSARDSWQHALSLLDELHHRDADSVRSKLTG